MANVAVWIKVAEDRIAQAIQEALDSLNKADGEVLLDFASVRRLDPKSLRALDEFADIAQHESVKVVLRGVNIDIYKVLKLVKMAKRFSFVN